MFARLTVDGKMDSSFGSNGKSLINIPELVADGASLAIQRDGRIVAAGNSRDRNIPNSKQLTVIRLRNDGSLDPSFGKGGIVRTDVVADKDESAVRVMVLPDERILVGGSASSDKRTYDFFLVRYNAEGGLDRTFGDAGKVITKEAGDLLLQPDGRIVVVSSSGRDST